MHPSSISTKETSASQSFIDKLIQSHVGHAGNLGIAVLDRDRRHIYANDIYAHIVKASGHDLTLGMTLDQIIKFMFAGEYFNSDYQTAIQDDLQKMGHLLKAGKETHTSRILKTAAARTLEMNGVYTQNHHLVMTIRDITEQTRHKELLDIALEEGGAGFWSYNFKTQKFTYSDSVKKRLTQNEISRVQETGLWALIMQEDLRDMMKSWHVSVTENKPIDLTYRLKTETDGIMWQRSKGRIITSSNGELSHAIVYVTDITDDVKMRDDLVSERKISHDKTEFLARMSHEIKTPLNAIIALSDTLLNSPELSEENLETIRFIDEYADHLNHLLNQTLEHAKLAADKITIRLNEESPRDIIENIYGLWKPKCADKKLSFKLSYDETIPEICRLDKMRVQQCLNNLISNAIKFTDNGSIHLIVKKVSQNNQDHLVCAIKDTGVGIDKTKCDKIFEAYEQADGSISRRFGGSGLGLNITKTLVKLMGGTLRVKSDEGKGSLFAFSLPLKTKQKDSSDLAVKQTITEQSPPHHQQTQIQTHLQTPLQELATPLAEQPSEIAFSGLDVLCVEDNKINQRVVERLIGKDIKTLTFANNGIEALEHLNAQHFDIVLMDIHMPEMNGIEATIEIRNSAAPWANVIIIALTADPEYQQKRICRNLGMNDAISKPVKRKEIMDAFNRSFRSVTNEYTHATKLTG